MTLSDEEIQDLQKSPDKILSLSTLLNDNISDVLSEVSDVYWTAEENVEVYNLECDDDAIYASCSITFEEQMPSGCEEMPHRSEREVEVSIRIDFETGDVIFSYEC